MHEANVLDEGRKAGQRALRLDRAWRTARRAVRIGKKDRTQRGEPFERVKGARCGAMAVGPVVVAGREDDRRAQALKLRVARAAACGAGMFAVAAGAAAAEPAGWRTGLATEAGRGNGTDMLRLALVAAPAAPLWSRATTSLSTFGELSIAHWRFPPPTAADRRRITVVGFTPYLRLRDTRIERWFFDFGIGVNTLSDLYETRDRRFSPHLQFSDHLAIGRSFGDDDAFEVSYRFAHYSNAGIRHPNPGVNFHVLRLEHRFP